MSSSIIIEATYFGVGNDHYINHVEIDRKFPLPRNGQRVWHYGITPSRIGNNNATVSIRTKLSLAELSDAGVPFLPWATLNMSTNKNGELEAIVCVAPKARWSRLFLSSSDFAHEYVRERLNRFGKILELTESGDLEVVNINKPGRPFSLPTRHYSFVLNPFGKEELEKLLLEGIGAGRAFGLGQVRLIQSI